MDNDLEKGSISSISQSDGANLAATQFSQQLINRSNLEEAAGSEDLSNNIQIQDFAQTSRLGSPTYGRRSSVNNLHDECVTPRAPSPVDGRCYSLEHESPEAPVPRSCSPVTVYIKQTSPSSLRMNSHENSPNLHSPSPVYGQRLSLGSTDENQQNSDHASGGRPPSPVYGLRVSLESQGEPVPSKDGLRTLKRQITLPTDSGPRRSFEVSEVNPIPSSASTVPIARPSPELQLDFNWIIEHHNNLLVAPIKLQAPPKRTQFLESVKEWRPWHMKKPSPFPGAPREHDWHRKDTEHSFRISIAELHRIRLRKLQCKLVNHAWYMKQNNMEPPPSTDKSPDGGSTTWEDDLQEYTKALQDYDYMTKCSTLPRDSFLVSGERKVDDYVMREIIGVHMHPTEQQNPIPVVGPWEEDNQPIGGTRKENVEKSWMKAFEKRFVMAALGGTFLVGPMWLMVLLGDDWFYTTLVSTTVFVYAFGMFMSVLLEKPMDVLSGTAAYAAVLVVFVGLGVGQNSAGTQTQGGGAGNGAVV